jgi:hypothetical protein
VHQRENPGALDEGLDVGHAGLEPGGHQAMDQAGGGEGPDLDRHVDVGGEARRPVEDGGLRAEEIPAQPERSERPGEISEQVTEGRCRRKHARRDRWRA